MLSNHVRECLRHAEDCMQQAATQTDPKLRRDYLIIAACWLKLIRELERQDRQFTAPAKLRHGEERTSGALVAAPNTPNYSVGLCNSSGSFAKLAAISSPGPLSMPGDVGSWDLASRSVCFVKHLSPVFTAPGP